MSRLLLLLLLLFICELYRHTRRRRERQRRGTYAVNVKLQESATAAVASPAAVANDNWAFVYDVNTSSPSYGHASLPRNKYEHLTIARPIASRP